jgi:uncharacterized protein (TIGR02266 family)
VDPNTRQAKRTPVTLKIKFKSATLEEFIERYAVDVSHGGIFIRTKEPLAVGTSMKFEFQLKDATPLIHGEGTVVWTREHDPGRPGVAPGMGVRFDRLGDGSQEVLDKILAQKSKTAAAATPAGIDPKVFEQPTRSFNEAPTKVAPSPLTGELADKSRSPKLGQMAPPRSGFQDERTDMTPLPNPVPFHSDADEFPDEAFEEATKVRAVDELVAQTAKAARPGAAKPGAFEEPTVKLASAEAAAVLAAAAVDAEDKAVIDELAARRAAREKAEAAAASEAPDAGAPASAASGPEPSALSADPTGEASPARAASADGRAVKHEPRPRRTATAPASTAVAPPAAAARPRRSALPFLLVVLALAAGSAAAYFLWYKKRGAAPGDATTAAAEPGKAAGLGAAAPGPTEAGAEAAASDDVTSAVVPPDAAATPVEKVAVTVGASVKGATIDLVDRDGNTIETGLAPLEAKLDKGQSYVARISATGFRAREVEVVAGGDPVTAELEPLPVIVRVTSTPQGATVVLGGRDTGHKTPADVAVPAKLAARSPISVGLKLPGYAPLETKVKTSAFEEDGDQMVATVSGTLRPIKKRTGGTAGGGTGTGTGDGDGAGVGTGDGGGTGTGTGTGDGGGATKPPGGGAGTGSQEPTPDWAQ